MRAARIAVMPTSSRRRQRQAVAAALSTPPSISMPSWRRGQRRCGAPIAAPHKMQESRDMNAASIAHSRQRGTGCRRRELRRE